VYRAFDHTREQEVALKLLHRREAEDTVPLRERFATLSQLAHPNLVRLYELVDEGERQLLSMELIEGVDLLRYVRTSDGVGFDEVRVRAVFGQLAQGLSALHAAHKVHRDVKPANVRVTVQGRVVLLDLDPVLDLHSQGSERGMGRVQRPLGTAVYMAPEQASGQRLGPGSDWYSMGVVLYEALSGARPYAGSDLAVLLEKQKRRPQPVSELVAGLPLDLAQLCFDLLSPNPQERPTGPEILRRLSVHEDVLSASWTAASLLSARPPFLGRSDELTRLARAFAQSHRSVTVVRVVGEAGMGKTALCAAALRRAAESEPQLLLLSGTCSRYPDRPHAPLHEPMARLAEALRERRSSARLHVSPGALRLLERTFPGVVMGLEAKNPGRTALAPEPLEQRWRSIGALSAILSELARQRPIAIWLDDYQWADVDTQRFINGLVENTDAPNLLLLLSEEPEPGGLGSPSPRAHETIELAHLSCQDATALIRELCDGAEGARDNVERLWLDGSVTGPYSPLALLERTRHALLFPDAEAEQATPSNLYAERVGQLSEPARRILELVCAAFDATPYAIFERASDQTAAEFTSHLAALRVAGLVRSLSVHGEDALAPGHSLVAELVDLELTGPRRVLIHQRLAAALIARDGVRAAGRLLRHQGESGDHGRAADSAERAAEQAYASFAFQRAAELFTLSASLRPPTPDEQGHRLLRRMAEALENAGWALSAAAVYREATQFASRADTLHMRQRTLECLVRGGELEEGQQVLRELLGSLGLSLQSPARAQWSLLLARMGSRMFGLTCREQQEDQIAAVELGKVDALFAAAAQLSRSDLLLGHALRMRALAAARALGEPKRIARALCTEAWSLVGVRRREGGRAQPLIEAARALVERHDSPLLAGHLRLAQGMAALSSHQMRECSTHCRDAERVFRDSCTDAAWELSVAQVCQAWALSTMGQYRELTPKLILYRREAEERGDEWTYTALLGVEAMSLSLASDLPELSELQVKESRSRWRARETLHTQALLNTLASTACDLYRRDECADVRLSQRFNELELREFLRVMFVRVSLLELRGRARLAVAAQRGELTRLRAVELDARRLLGEHERSATGFAELLMANVHMLRGDHAGALAALERGIAELEPLGLDPWVQCAHLALGQLRGGDRGHTLEETARAQMKARGVQRIDRYLAMMMPAFVS
jgi:eukaryotic-like serine/threonine-protein kinase